MCWCPGLTDELGLNFTPQDESICDDGRGSGAPTAHRLPCCHAPNIHGAIMPSGQVGANAQISKEIPPRAGRQHLSHGSMTCTVLCLLIE